MLLTLSQKHLNFFASNGFIELEELISETEAAALSSSIDLVLQERLKKLIETKTPAEMFRSGRDLWKSSPAIAKKSMSRPFASLMAALTGARAVRLAYDQALRTTGETGPVFPAPCPLSEVSCFQPLIGGIILRLKYDPHPPELLPKKVGSALFFTPALPLPWESLTQTPGQSFLLLAYGPERCVYVLEKRDPHTHELKREGYVFGDLLKTPLLYK